MTPDDTYPLTWANPTRRDKAGCARTCGPELKNPWASAREGSTPSPGTTR
jgi:hypothetical protein